MIKIMTKIVNVKKERLNARNIKDFQEWQKLPNTIYIGRNMSFYVSGAIQSKWHNPFNSKNYPKEECLKLYEEHILDTPQLYNSLLELDNKELGCWCKPDKCHGDVLIKLLNKYKEEHNIK